MDMPIFEVDFNEMVEPNLVLLSAFDERADVTGVVVDLSEGMRVRLRMTDYDSNGKRDDLVAAGSVEKTPKTGWADHVKWSCRIDEDGVRVESEALSSTYPAQRIFQEVSAEIRHIVKHAGKLRPALVLLWLIGVALAIKDHAENYIPRSVVDSRSVEMYRDAGFLEASGCDCRVVELFKRSESVLMFVDVFRKAGEPDFVALYKDRMSERGWTLVSDKRDVVVMCKRGMLAQLEETVMAWREQVPNRPLYGISINYDRQSEDFCRRSGVPGGWVKEGDNAKS
jgi:hypothetical protein